MKSAVTEAFDSDFTRLPHAQQRRLKRAIREELVAAVENGALDGDSPRPRALGLRLRSADGVYAITWDFGTREAHATFHLAKCDDGEVLLVWRRLGDHSAHPHRSR
ncbi:hypothetical protein EKD16_19820 [Streptomonospora litoralis]|uniref:Cytotoxic translational repressor of toxin-antitoxin stability system n=1 Tax=Streptomonospora litoralis TaxID=2498135 RepID=A0A4P6Q9H6_9ACTN|nr:hypothetical protein EKD16_19820 [Streptomonospora litoralis]